MYAVAAVDDYARSVERRTQRRAHSRSGGREVLQRRRLDFFVAVIQHAKVSHAMLLLHVAKYAGLRTGAAIDDAQCIAGGRGDDCAAPAHRDLRIRRAAHRAGKRRGAGGAAGYGTILEHRSCGGGRYGEGGLANVNGLARACRNQLRSACAARVDNDR